MYIYLWFCGLIFKLNNTGPCMLGCANNSLLKLRIWLLHSIIWYKCECSVRHKFQTCVSAIYWSACHQFWALKWEYMMLNADHWPLLHKQYSMNRLEKDVFHNSNGPHTVSFLCELKFQNCNSREAEQPQLQSASKEDKFH